MPPLRYAVSDKYPGRLPLERALPEPPKGISLARRCQSRQTAAEAINYQEL